MEMILAYILKSGGIMLFILMAYYALLRHETFFRSNRFYLVGGILVSLILPLITFTRTVFVEATEIPIESSLVLSQKVPQQMTEQPAEINWTFILLGIYLAGAAFFTLKLILDFIDLKKVLWRKSIIRSGNYKLLEVGGNIAPFSYFNYIVYNPELYTKIELGNILEHEKVHCRQLHSVDVIISRIYCIIFWFNPFAWLYKKTIIQNLEFIADSEASGKIADRLSYQITLVKVTAHENCVAITNHFYQSLIKKRIVMLNKNQSRRLNQWKYGIVFPVLLAFMLQFQVNVIAQSKKTGKEKNVATVTYSEDNNAKIDAFMVLPSTTDAELRSYEEMLQKQYGMKMTFSKVVRNNSEIKAFDFWYDDKSGKPQTLKVYVQNPEDLFFMVQIKKDKSGKNRINVNTYNKNHAQTYDIKADTLVWKDDNAILNSDKVADKNILIINEDKQYWSDDIVKGGFLLEIEGSINQLSKEEAVARYGDKGKDGVWIITGKTELVPKQKPATEFPKTITLENGDQVVFMKEGQMKLPGFPMVSFGNSAELIVNDVKYKDSKAVIENMDLDRIKSIQIHESKNPNGIKTIKVEMKLKQ